jgi:hypothetical protein
MMRLLLACFLVAVLTAAARAQTPQPFPRAGTAPGVALGVTVYPGAQFLGSYDAGRGQRYYLFGATASFAELVGYYRTQIGERGDLVFKDPQTHMFTGGTLARYREETMAFPPSVTVKDWTGGGSAGYPNPKIGAQPQRFPTVIMIVPPPAGAPAAR